jgi:hypothetical protein
MLQQSLQDLEVYQSSPASCSFINIIRDRYTCNLEAKIIENVAYVFVWCVIMILFIVCCCNFEILIVSLLNRIFLQRGPGKTAAWFFPAHWHSLCLQAIFDISVVFLCHTAVEGFRFSINFLQAITLIVTASLSRIACSLSCRLAHHRASYCSDHWCRYFGSQVIHPFSTFQIMIYCSVIN